MASEYIIPATILRDIAAHAIEGYPEEVCGLIFAQKSDGALARSVRMANIQNRLHLHDPQRYPRNATNAFAFDDREHLAAQRDMRALGLEQRIIYHSHPDVGAYFSEEDRTVAAPDGEPWYPEIGHLVVSVRKGGAVDAARLYFWSDERKDFIEYEVPLP